MTHGQGTEPVIVQGHPTCPQSQDVPADRDAASLVYVPLSVEDQGRPGPVLCRVGAWR